MSRRALLAALLLAAGPVRAAFQDPLWSARAAALGGAYTAVSDDAGGLFYNPSALAGLEGRQASFSYAKLFAGLDEVNLSLNQLAYVHPLSESSALGLGWGRFSSAGIHAEDTGIISYSRRFPRLYPGDRKGFAAAAAVRYLAVSFQADALSASDPVFRKGRRRAAAAVDLHFHTEALLEWLPGSSVGLSAKALNSPDIGFSVEERVPREFLLGFRYEKGRWSLPADLAARDGEWKLKLGVEASFMDKRVFVRAGGEPDQAGTGLGYRHALSGGSTLAFDYSFLYPLKLEGSSGSHRVTLGLQF